MHSWNRYAFRSQLAIIKLRAHHDYVIQVRAVKKDYWMYIYRTRLFYVLITEVLEGGHT